MEILNKKKKTHQRLDSTINEKRLLTYIRLMC
jgi:hypothetical protein